MISKIHGHRFDIESAEDADLEFHYLFQVVRLQFHLMSSGDSMIPFQKCIGGQG